MLGFGGRSGGDRGVVPLSCGEGDGTARVSCGGGDEAARMGGGGDERVSTVLKLDVEVEDRWLLNDPASTCPCSGDRGLAGIL